MEISQVTGSYDQGYLTDAVNSELGKDEFLSLLVTQLQYQDPLDPMDNSQFVAQLAQFSSLEQMTNLNSAYADQSALIQSMNNNLTASFVGQEVVVSNDTFRLSEGDTVKVGAYLNSAAGEVRVEVLDANGQTVRSLHMHNVRAGTQVIEWDGLDAAGKAVAEGKYSISVEAVDVAGNEIDAYALIAGKVDSVSFDQGSAYLSVAGTQVPIGTLIQVLSGEAGWTPPIGDTPGDETGSDTGPAAGDGSDGDGGAGAAGRSDQPGHMNDL